MADIELGIPGVIVQIIQFHRFYPIVIEARVA